MIVFASSFGSLPVEFAKIDIRSEHQVLFGVAPVFQDQVVESLRVICIDHAQAAATRHLEKAAVAADSAGAARVGHHVHLDLPRGIFATRFRILRKEQVVGAGIQRKEAVEASRERGKRGKKRENCKKSSKNWHLVPLSVKRYIICLQN